MQARQFQGLILGFIVGLALFAFFYYETQNMLCLILIPIAAVMGLAPQLLKPRDMDDDD